MKTLSFACLAAAALSGPFDIQSQAEPPPLPAGRPNIIIILADDIGYGELSCYGQKRYETPQIDKFAREGLRFMDFYGAPECTPSRCSLMTGLDSGHERLRANFSYDAAGHARRVALQPGDVTAAKLLHSAGYATGCVGKWGLGEEGTSGVPGRQGFDTFYGFLNDAHAHNYYPEFIYRNAEKVALPGNYGFAQKTFIDDLFMKEALAFLDRHRAQPFFLYLALTLPHGKLTAPDDALLHQPLDLSDGYPADRVQPSSPVFAAMVRRVDRDVGEIMARVRELGLDRNTLVFVASDNGPAHLGPTPDDTVDVDFFHASGPLRGEKSDVYEGGIRVPCLVRWPGHIAPGRVSAVPLAMWDFLPTLAAVAGAPAPTPTDGLSFLPELLGQPQPRHPYLYWEFISKGQPRRAVRLGDWKIDQYGLKKPFALYDLATDPGESRDVAAEHPAIFAQMTAIARKAHVDSADFPLLENSSVRASAAPVRSP